MSIKKTSKHKQPPFNQQTTPTINTHHLQIFKQHFHLSHWHISINPSPIISQWMARACKRSVKPNTEVRHICHEDYTAADMGFQLPQTHTSDLDPFIRHGHLKPHAPHARRKPPRPEGSES